MKIVTVVGARPQFVKAAVVSRVLRADSGVREVLVHTGQHYDHNVSGVFFSEMDIPEPDYHLGVGSGSHGKQTGKMLEAIESALVSEKPDMVLVYGDTNSTLAGALAAAKLNIPVAHVEAGLRSFNRRMPEEINRVMTDHLASILFAPTETATRNLRQEGVAEKLVVRTGDVMYDSALHYAAKAEAESRILQSAGTGSRGYILATVHRAENTDDIARLKAILSALSLVSAETPVVIPMHPRTQSVISKNRELAPALEYLQVLDPVGYLDMITLERHARLIVTDSGGVQKEASFHNVRCVTLRDETEWEELIELGRNVLVPPAWGADKIAAAIREALSLLPLENSNVYGDGKAANAIVQSLLAFPTLRAV